MFKLIHRLGPCISGLALKNHLSLFSQLFAFEPIKCFIFRCNSPLDGCPCFHSGLKRHLYWMTHKIIWHSKRLPVLSLRVS